MFHSLFLGVGLQFSANFGVYMNCFHTEDMALVVMDIYGQTVFLRFTSERAEETMMLVQWVTVWIFSAYKAFCLVLLQDAFHDHAPSHKDNI